MPEIRIDPLSGHRSIIAGERSKRPGGEPRCEAPPPIDPATDPFAEGHEDRTPPELYAVRPGGGPPNSPGWTRSRGAQPLPRARPRREHPELPAQARARSCSPRSPRTARTR